MASPVILTSDRVRAEIDPDRGARLVSLHFDGREVLGGADDLEQAGQSLGTGSYPMVPWAGRVAGRTMHGTGRDRAWIHHGDGRFSVDLAGEWPDSGTASQKFTVTNDALTVTLAWETDGAHGCSLGFHPWFRRVVGGVDVELDVDPTCMVERGPDRLPTGRLVTPASEPWDDCFVLAASPRLRWPGVLDLTLESDANWWVVYTEPQGALCVEPQTAPPDAWNHPVLRPAVWPTSVCMTIRLT